jgi:hypothetical protein
MKVKLLGTGTCVPCTGAHVAPSTSRSPWSHPFSLDNLANN